MDITEMFRNSEQKLFLENLERLRNASRTASEEDIIRVLNESTAITDDSYFSRPVEVLLILLYSVLAVIGFFLNTFMSCVILFSKKLLRNPSNLLVLNLMTSDLLMVIFCVPFTLMSLIWKSWIFGRGMCKLIPYLQSVSIIVSSATIAMIAIDRLIRVTKNISTNSYHSLFARTHWVMITAETAMIWIFALIVSAPIAFFQILISMTVRSSLIFSKCMEIWPQGTYKGVYAITNVMIQFFLPTIILVYTNIRIRRHLEGNLSGLDNNHADNNGSNSTNRSTRMTRVTISAPESSVASAHDQQSVNMRIPSYLSLRIGRWFSCHSFSGRRIQTAVTSEFLDDGQQDIESDGSDQSSGRLSACLPRRSGSRESERTDTISRNRSLLMKEISRNRQVTRTLFSIVFSFTITWLPWNIFNIYLDFDHDSEMAVESTYLILAFCYLVAMTTIPVNAFLYGWRNPSIRSEALTLLGLIKQTIADTEPPAEPAGGGGGGGQQRGGSTRSRRLEVGDRNGSPVRMESGDPNACRIIRQPTRSSSA